MSHGHTLFLDTGSATNVVVVLLLVVGVLVVIRFSKY